MTAATIVIPTYNAGEYLHLAVQCALRQTHEPLEVLVVDDGSTDGSLASIERINDARLRVLRQSNAGKSAALNLALREMSGTYYCVLDADDEMHPRRVARQVEVLDANPDLAAVFCGHELIIGPRRMAPRLRPMSRSECAHEVAHVRMPAHDPTGMYRVSMVRGLDYDVDLRIGQGYDYIMRVGEQWPMLVLGECLYGYRVREGSVTRNNVERRRAAVDEVRRKAALRRGDDAPTGPTIAPVRNRDLDNGLPAHFIESVADLRRLGRRVEALRTALACGALHPFDADYWKPLAAGILPNVVLSKLRSSA